jgi:N-acetylglutamate synthase-like GNAT family acetyltransferase
MERKDSPRVTGMSDITGETVKIRHAIEADMAFIEEELGKSGIDAETLDYGEFVVATEEGNIVGFGRLRKTGKFYQIGCVAVVEERRSRGIGALIVKHLLDFAQVDMVYVLTDLVDYFKKMGFVEMKEGSKELFDALDEECKVRGKPNTVIMVHEK